MVMVAQSAFETSQPLVDLGRRAIEGRIGIGILSLPLNQNEATDMNRNVGTDIPAVPGHGYGRINRIRKILLGDLPN
jgi:hypothetical protein